MSHSETGLADSFVAQNKRLAVPVAIAVSRIVGKSSFACFLSAGSKITYTRVDDKYFIEGELPTRIEG